MFHSIAHEWAQRTSKMSNWTREDKFHIYARPCIILYLSDKELETICSLLYFTPETRSANAWFTHWKSNKRRCTDALRIQVVPLQLIFLKNKQECEWVPEIVWDNSWIIGMVGRKGGISYDRLTSQYFLSEYICSGCFMLLQLFSCMTYFIISFMAGSFIMHMAEEF